MQRPRLDLRFGSSLFCHFRYFAIRGFPFQTVFGSSKTVQLYRRPITRNHPALVDVFSLWTVEVDRGLELEKRYILTSGDPERPEKNHPVEPGWPFYTGEKDFREGRVEAFSDWLTSQEGNHFPAVIETQTGHRGRAFDNPSFGSWVSYALGSGDDPQADRPRSQKDAVPGVRTHFPSGGRRLRTD
jgi:hypothetical protein